MKQLFLTFLLMSFTNLMNAQEGYFFGIAYSAERKEVYITNIREVKNYNCNHSMYGTTPSGCLVDFFHNSFDLKFSLQAKYYEFTVIENGKSQPDNDNIYFKNKSSAVNKKNEIIKIFEKENFKVNEFKLEL